MDMAATSRLTAFASVCFAGLGGIALTSCKEGAPPKAALATTYGQSRCAPVPANRARQGSEFGELMSRNVLAVDQRALQWNGVPITRPTLKEYLGDLRALSPGPALVIVFDPTTSCDVVETVRRTIAGEKLCGSLSVCVEYSAAEWEKMKPPPVF